MLRRSRTVAGFTLLELMIVLAIIGIAAAVGLPNIVASKPYRQLKSAARDIFGDCMKARMEAASRYRPRRIFFDLDNRQFRVEQRDQAPGDPCEATSSCTWTMAGFNKNLPATVTGVSVNGVTSGTASQVFNVNGTAGAGNVTLTNTQGQRFRITVSNTGRMQMVKL